MPKRVFWLDNDPGSVKPYVDLLVRNGHEVQCIDTLLAGEAALAAQPFDLVILDVMIPTRSAEEEQAYPAEKTKMGYEAGLAFFERMQARIRESGAKVMILSVRPRADLDPELKRLGLDNQSFHSKIAMRDARVFARRVDELLAAGTEGQTKGGQR